MDPCLGGPGSTMAANRAVPYPWTRARAALRRQPRLRGAGPPRDSRPIFEAFWTSGVPLRRDASRTPPGLVESCPSIPDIAQRPGISVIVDTIVEPLDALLAPRPVPIPPDPAGRHPRSLIAREDSVLCVVDLQHRFLNKLAPDVRERLTDTARFVIEVARRLAIPRFVTVEDPARNGGTVEAIRACLGAEDLDRDKRVFGLGSQPDLASALLAQPRRTAILIGLETDVCILHSAVGLAELGFRAVLVADATGAPGAEHELGLERARVLGLETIHSKGLYYEWLRSLDGLAMIAAEPAIRPPPGSAL